MFSSFFRGCCVFPVCCSLSLCLQMMMMMTMMMKLMAVFFFEPNSWQLVLSLSLSVCASMCIAAVSLDTPDWAGWRRRVRERRRIRLDSVTAVSLYIPSPHFSLSLSSISCIMFSVCVCLRWFLIKTTSRDEWRRKAGRQPSSSSDDQSGEPISLMSRENGDGMQQHTHPPPSSRQQQQQQLHNTRRKESTAFHFF